MPDLLNYLEMVERGEIIEKRIEKIKLLNQKEKKKLSNIAFDDRKCKEE